MKYKLLLALSILFLFGFNLHAIEIRHSDNDLTESGQYTDDYMGYGSSVDFQGEAKDLFLFSRNNVTLSGKAGLALFALGRNIDILGSTGNGVKAAGKAIFIKGDIEGTSFLAGSTITMDSDSVINGDTFMVAQTSILRGRINGDLYLSATDVTIQNEIYGDVRLSAKQINFAGDGRIIGSLIYSSDEKLSEELAERVVGEVVWDQENEILVDEEDEEVFTGIDEFDLFLALSFVASGLLVLLFPVSGFLERDYSPKEIGGYALTGLVPIVAYPTTTILLIIPVITIPLSLTLMLAFAPIVFITKVVGVSIIGKLLTTLLKIKVDSRFLFFLIGSLAYTILSLIPYIDDLTFIGVSSTGCGFLVAFLLKERLKEQKPMVQV